MTDLRNKRAFNKSKIFTAFILSVDEVFPYTNLDAVLNITQRNLFNQLKTFSNGFLSTFPYIWAPGLSQSLKKHRTYAIFALGSNFCFFFFNSFGFYKLYSILHEAKVSVII